MKSIQSICVLCIVITGLFTQLPLSAQEKEKVEEGKMKMKSKDKTSRQMNMKFTPLDTLVIERIMGMKGKYSNGEYKVTIPQNDLSIEVDGFKIIPAMGLGTWIDFAPDSEGAM